MDSLPAYMQHMDVLILSYRRTGYTQYITPMKLQEYLATGRPVVATPIRGLQDYFDVISPAETPETWSREIAGGLEEKEFTVQGMTCQACVRKVSGALTGASGVHNVSVDLEAGLVKVSGRGLKDSALKAAIEGKGYKVV